MFSPAALSQSLLNSFISFVERLVINPSQLISFFVYLSWNAAVVRHMNATYWTRNLHTNINALFDCYTSGLSLDKTTFLKRWNTFFESCLFPFTYIYNLIYSKKVPTRTLFLRSRKIFWSKVNHCLTNGFFQGSFFLKIIVKKASLLIRAGSWLEPFKHAG